MSESSLVGYIHSIETAGTLDGPGIRYIAFLQGCPLRCLYCHNPDSWKRKTGQTMSPKDLFQDILRYGKFIRSGGVTLSGGEPLVQSDFVQAVFALCRAENIHTAVDTSGIIDLSICQSALEETDLVILDIKALDPELSKRISGADNRNALALLDWLEINHKPVWIRQVILPGYTDNLQELEKLSLFLRDYSVVKKVELLPFHQMGAHKWESLGYQYLMKNAKPPSQEFMNQAMGIFKKNN